METHEPGRRVSRHLGNEVSRLVDGERSEPPRGVELGYALREGGIEEL